MIYRSTNHINFAQGEMGMLSAYLCWVLLNAGFNYVFAVLITLAASFAFGVVVQIVVIKKLAKASRFVIIIGYIGLFMIFSSIAGAMFGYIPKTFPSPFEGLAIRSLGISGHVAGTLLTLMLLMAVVYAFFRFTKMGLSMRAVAVEPVTSRLAGINVGLMLALGWGFAAVIGSISALLAAPVFYLEPHMMVGVLCYAFAGALLGGISNPWGAVAGSLIVGVLENLMGAYVVGTEIKLTIAFFLIVGVLVLKPEGLFGRRLQVRV
jgi:branched-chain amino acid transport system permease protein